MAASSSIPWLTTECSGQGSSRHCQPCKAHNMATGQTRPQAPQESMKSRHPHPCGRARESSAQQPSKAPQHWLHKDFQVTAAVDATTVRLMESQATQ